MLRSKPSSEATATNLRTGRGPVSPLGSFEASIRGLGSTRGPKNHPSASGTAGTCPGPHIEGVSLVEEPVLPSPVTPDEPAVLEMVANVGDGIYAAEEKQRGSASASGTDFRWQRARSGFEGPLTMPESPRPKSAPPPPPNPSPPPNPNSPSNPY